MSVLLAHPGVGPYVRATVEAFAEAEMLERFATTVVDDPSSPWQRIARRLGGSRMQALIARREPPNVPRSRIATRPMFEILRTLSSRIDRSRILTDHIWDVMTQDFDSWASRQITSQTKAVYGYEYNCLSLFAKAKHAGIRTILEVPCAEHEYVSDLIVAAERAAGASDSAYARRAARLRTVRTARRRQELELADLVVANSKYTVSSYVAVGLPTSKFVVVPLGAPPIRETANASAHGPLRLVWAGTLSARKGFFVLLDALSGWSGSELQLDFFGSRDVAPSDIGKLPPWARWHGPVSQQQLFAALSAADVLVQPSISDAFAMTVTEALAHGVPVITTTATGASSFVRDGENGFVVDPGDARQLAERIRWFCEHRAALPAMRAASRESAAAWQWSDYKAAIAKIVGNAIGRG